MFSSSGEETSGADNLVEVNNSYSIVWANALNFQVVLEKNKTF